jgi:transposase
MTVTISGKNYRAIVVHSDAHDKRRQKKLARQLAESRGWTEQQLQQAGKTKYFCREDAEAAVEKLHREPAPYHFSECRVEERMTYATGRPPKNGERKVTGIRYVLTGTVVERAAEVAQRNEVSGCFVLLTNTPTAGTMAHSPQEALLAYKEQHGIEQNFGFLKDPNIVNDLFLKKPEHIEVLGFILLTSLLIWRLLEHVMREYLKQTGTTVPGWDRKPTPAPTAFMMTTKFIGLMVAEVAGEWFFPTPLSAIQQAYVRALGLSEEVLLRKKSAGE